MTTTTQTNAPTVTIQHQLDAEWIDGVLVTAIEAGFPWHDWTGIERNTTTPPRSEQLIVAAVATEYDPDEGTPTEDGASKRIDGAAIAEAVSKIVGGSVKISPDIRDSIRAAVAENDPGHIDIIGADCIVQVALHGELVYG